MPWLSGGQVFPYVEANNSIHWLETTRCFVGRYAQSIGQTSGGDENLHNAHSWDYFNQENGQEDQQHITTFRAMDMENGYISSDAEIILWGYSFNIPSTDVVKRIKIFGQIDGDRPDNISLQIGFSDTTDHTLGNVEWSDKIYSLIETAGGFNLWKFGVYGSMQNTNHTDSDLLNTVIGQSTITFPYTFNSKKLRIKISGFENHRMIDTRYWGLDIYHEPVEVVKMKVSSGKTIINGKVKVR
tara:strand:+ start:2821 stop:3546 length:726 start_codon:yes stop_codon:yes gene_type:complete